MKRLELKQGISYAVKGFSCVKGVPFNVDDEMAKKLLATGRFMEIQYADDGDTDIDEIDAFMALFGSITEDIGQKTEENENELENMGNKTEGNGNELENMGNKTEENGNELENMGNKTEENGKKQENIANGQQLEKILSADSISRMKKPELEALASKKDIDISDCNNNDERAAKICGALGLASFAQMGLED